MIFAAAKHGTDIDVFVSKVLLGEDVEKEQLLNIMRECEFIIDLLLIQMRLKFGELF